MRKLLAGAALLLLVGCADTRGFIDADAIAGVVGHVCARHDRYVIEDKTISDIHRAVYLRSSEVLQAVVNQALSKK